MGENSQISVKWRRRENMCGPSTYTARIGPIKASYSWDSFKDRDAKTETKYIGRISIMLKTSEIRTITEEEMRIRLEAGLRELRTKLLKELEVDI